MTMLTSIILPLAQIATRMAEEPAEGGKPVLLILGIILGVTVIVLFVSMAQRYKRCPSNKVLVIYGKTSSGAARCIHGGAAFVWPLFQAYDYLDLEPFVVPIDLKNALSQENIRVSVPTTVTAAISNEDGIMQNAAVRLLELGRLQERQTVLCDEHATWRERSFAVSIESLAEEHRAGPDRIGRVHKDHIKAIFHAGNEVRPVGNHDLGPRILERAV